MAETPDLLPCPFCGGEARFHEIDNDEDENFGAHFIQCDEPMCSVSSVLRWGNKCDPEPLLAEAWNRRTSADALDAAEHAMSETIRKFDTAVAPEVKNTPLGIRKLRDALALIRGKDEADER